LRLCHQGGDLLFPARGKRFQKAMAESAMLSLINGDTKRGGWGLGLTVHGFRSTLRDWGAENGHRDDAMEWVIAHGVPNDRTVAAYKRTTFFNERVKIMEAWSAHCVPRQRHLKAVA
jgi:integrase